MDASRRSPPADARAGDPVVRAVDAALATHLDGARRVAIALSGGRDSVALLMAVLECGRVQRDEVVAIHVHHGLSSHADAWAARCASLAAEQRVAMVTRRVTVDGSLLGIEAAARSARYAALASAAVDAGAATVLLAHHQDDQAETVLLQLLRGAGVDGLAAMPVVRSDRGLRWLRPLLDVPRSAIDAYVRGRGLLHVDDDSNASERHRRNALRRRVLPVLAAIAPGATATIARAAAHAAEAARLIDDLALQDTAPLLRNGTLDRAGVAALPPHRARNVLRHFVRLQGLRPPSTARLEAMLVQLRNTRSDARMRFVHDGRWFGVHRGRLIAHDPAPPSYALPWQGEPFLALPHGTLRFEPACGLGLSAARVAGGALVVRPRRGGERLQPFPARPRRALKSWLYEADLPGWQRESLPLLFCGEVLVAVPGLGVDVAFQARDGEPGFTLGWTASR